MSLNHIALLGRVDHTPELRYTPEGQPVTRLLLHVDKPEGGADPIRVIARKELAESVPNLLKKGDLAAAEGRLVLRTYQMHDGSRHKVAEVEADRITRIVDGDALRPHAEA